MSARNEVRERKPRNRKVTGKGEVTEGIVKSKTEIVVECNMAFQRDVVSEDWRPAVCLNVKGKGLNARTTNELVY